MAAERHIDSSTYEVIDVLREGATADVTLVRNRITQQLQVIKTYSVLAVPDAVANAEPRLLSRIDHPHIIRALDAFYASPARNEITFVSPFCEGGSVLTALTEGQLFSVHHALKLSLHVLDALDHVHRVLGWVHRDVKPSNAFLDRDRRLAMLGDFGSAAARQDSDGGASPVLGTLLYQPPEAAVQDGRHTPVGDLYGVGLTLFELLNGHFDYASLDFDIVERRLRRGWLPVPSASLEFEPHVQRSVRSIVRKSIRSDPSRRWQTAREMSTALRNLRVVDWCRKSGSGLDGIWAGTWPPAARDDRRRTYFIESRVLRGGASAGKRRLVATQAVEAGRDARGFGVKPQTVEGDDVAALEAFFEEVQDVASKLVPAAR